MAAMRICLLAIVGLVGVMGVVDVSAAQRSGLDRSTSKQDVAPTRSMESSVGAAPSGVLTATWIGPTAGGLWSDASNWDTTMFPNNGNGAVAYDVVIMSNIADLVVINLDTDVEIGALFLRGTLDSELVTANLIINGPFDWQGQLLGPGTTTANGGITDTTLGIAVGLCGGRILENAGLATLRAPSTIIVDNGAKLNNLASGTINLQTGINTTNGGEVNNFGLIFTETNRTMDGVFNNDGAVEVRASGLQLRSDGIHSGTFDVAAFAGLTLAPANGLTDFTATSGVSGAGDLNLGGGFATNIFNVAGAFDLTGKVKATLSTVNFTSLPTSTGFSLELASSSTVNFDSGVPSLTDLVLTSGTFHVNGDATIAGPVRWDDTMSGAGTTTTNGLVRAVTGLTLDGRTLIANGGLRWQGSDFLLDNGAVFRNAEGSTFNMDLIRARLIRTTTPGNPGRIVNAGITTQIDGPPVSVMTEWAQTATGTTAAESLTFLRNTDISGAVTVPSGFRNAITFAGPDTGATITHRLNPDSTLTAQGIVNVGDPRASGSDSINAEFAGTVDFSDSRAKLTVQGANTTLALPLSSGNAGTVAGPTPTDTLRDVDVLNATLILYGDLVACCQSDGSCVDTSAARCDASGGVERGRGSTCEETTCGFGACCFDDSTCSLTFPPNPAGRCTDQGGEFLGVNSICDDCAPGACCLPNGSCIFTLALVCKEVGGDFLGQSSTCGPVSCPDAQTAPTIAISTVVLDDGSLDITTIPGREASRVSATNLTVRGTSEVTGTGASTANLDLQGVLFNFGTDYTLHNVSQTVAGTGPCEFGSGSLNLEQESSHTIDGSGQVNPRRCFLGRGMTVDSQDESGFFVIDLAKILVDNPPDASTPSVQFGAFVDITDSTVEAACPQCPGDKPTVQCDLGCTVGGQTTFSGVDATVQPGLTVAANGEWTLNDATVVVGDLDIDAAKTIGLKDSTLAIALTPESGLAIDADFLELNNALVEFLDADGTSTLGFLSGFISLEREVLDDLTRGRPFVIVITTFETTGTFPDGMRINPGDSTEAPDGIGTATIDLDEVVVEPGAVLGVDIDPLAVGQRNDMLEISANTTTYSASLEISLAANSECAVSNADAFAIVTGTSITYPAGGNGRRVPTMSGEGFFTVNQSPTGIVLDSFTLGGDGNGDRAVDPLDTAEFAPCMLGPNGGLSAGCNMSDYDGDGQCDLRDFRVLQDRFGTNCP